MPSTHLSLPYHLLFSTKERLAVMHKDGRARLHTYRGGIIKEMGGVPETVGGVEDHVHLLVGLRATHRLADVLRDLKSSSSQWVHEELHKPLFAWQEGYGAFTVSASQIEASIIANGRSRKNIWISCDRAVWRMTKNICGESCAPSRARALCSRGSGGSTTGSSPLCLRHERQVVL